MRGFYLESQARIALVLAVAVLAYGGGAAMFWYHAIYLEEGGPAISPWWHWLLDSTAGFIALGPVIAVILPLSAWIVQRSPTEPIDTGRVAILGGCLLALFTAPAPLLHNMFIARGTWLAERITDLVGNGHTPHRDPEEVSVAVEMGRQVLAGIPMYVPIMWLAIMIGRAGARLLSSRRAAL